MFDPTIFDNLKVVFEGAVYDMDLGDVVQIVDRLDRIELSSMSRSFGMTMKRRQGGLAEGSFRLKATVADLSAELLSAPRKKPGCSLELSFEFRINHLERDCAYAAAQIEEIWGKDLQMSQLVMMEFGQQPLQMKSKLVLRFPDKLDESHIDDIPNLLDHMLLSLERLDEREDAQ
jgi:hypothetical protein